MMMQISRAPSSASSGWFSLRRSRVMYAWASARGLREGEARRGQGDGRERAGMLPGKGSEGAGIGRERQG